MWCEFVLNSALQMFWEGEDSQNSPVLHIAAPTKWPENSSTDTARQSFVRAFTQVLDQGLDRMIAAGVATFCICIKASEISHHASIDVIRQCMAIVADGFPFRLRVLIVGPVTLALRTMWMILLPTMPAHIRDVAVLARNPQVTVRALMKDGSLPTCWA
jgi:hypothetical protein